jgi:hypothetical protein
MRGGETGKIDRKTIAVTICAVTGPTGPEYSQPAESKRINRLLADALGQGTILTVALEGGHRRSHQHADTISTTSHSAPTMQAPIPTLKVPHTTQSHIVIAPSFPRIRRKD